MLKRDLDRFCIAVENAHKKGNGKIIIDDYRILELIRSEYFSGDPYGYGMVFTVEKSAHTKSLRNILYHSDVKVKKVGMAKELKKYKWTIMEYVFPVEWELGQCYRLISPKDNQYFMFYL